MRDLGLLADWKLITGDQTFYSVTKAIHNGLQGAPRELTPAEQETYLTHSARNAQLLEAQYDLVVVHDPQPLALLKLHGRGQRGESGVATSTPQSLTSRSGAS